MGTKIIIEFADDDVNCVEILAAQMDSRVIQRADLITFVKNGEEVVYKDRRGTSTMKRVTK